MGGEETTATAISRLQDRIPASLYEVAWQYSLFDWLDAAQSSALDWDLAPEHLAFLTPRAKSGLFGEGDSLITVYADLSDPANPALGSSDDGRPVTLSTYTEADRFRVGHSYPEGKTSSMTDYSITTHKSADAHHIAGLRDDAWGTNNIQDRFTDWAQSEYAETVREEASDADAAILDTLAALGDDSEAMDALASAFLELVGDEDEELDALITVAVRLPGEDNYKLPGEVSVLNEVMRAKKAARLENISVDDASGDGTGYVTDEPGRVTGGSPGLFGMFGKKQREHFPDLDTDGSSAWRTRPLSFDVAAAVAMAGSLFDDFYRGLGSSRRLYVLPYLAARRDEVDTETFEWFHEEVYGAIQSAEGGSDGNFDNVLENVIRKARLNNDPDAPSADDIDMSFGDTNRANWDLVRIAVVHQVTGNPDRVYFDTLDGLSPAAALEDTHNEVTESAPFRNDGIFAANPSPDSSPLLGRALPLTRYILYGGYFQRTTEPTRSSREASETPGAGDADDSRMQRVRRLLTETRLDARGLLEEYLHQLVQEQRERFAEESEYIAFPTREVVEQYVQLRALTRADAIDTTDTLQFSTTEMPDEFKDRDDRLEQFLKNHDALSGDPEKAVFLLGGLIGRISAYQSREGISSTLIRRYPVDYLTKQTAVEVTKEVLQMNNSYGEADERRSYWTNSRYTDKLPDLMLSAKPNTWSLSEAELQWLYSLGIAYGLNDTSLSEEDESADENSAEIETEA
ncbi:hypothetical protein KU306_18190 (plasmid) [Haloferax larsenii]|uniref:CRISPR-associated protein, Csh1 family n=1 Tax=Haloferax larsenii TaxID=302484 RepID=A0ABY5RIS0_HALLR|nr:TM1802 family CRISPR-associated protein [Haloferax larsenii]UVE52259.1 hypothetical protein KU306_18190 [Haloferax larsenii]